MIDKKSYLLGAATGGGGDAKLSPFKFITNGEFDAKLFGYDGFSKAIIEVKPNLEDTTITANGTYTSENADGFGSVVVDVQGGGEPIVLSGDCRYAFYATNGQKLIEAGVRAENINNAEYMFASNPARETPECSFAASVSNISNMFNNANYFRTIPLDFNTQTSGYCCSLFRECYSLRTVPKFYYNIDYTGKSYAYHQLYYAFYNCYTLDEAINIPVGNKQNYSNDMLSQCFLNNHRLSRLTFEPNATVNWTKQTINLSSYVGYYHSLFRFTDYNSGITADKEVKDVATYAALKNDPDWFTTKIEFSRYNKTSAVETINSLPDTSAYLATAGGTNTIKFTGNAGSATDGGAINTMTADEIAVAAAKGWTVSFV